MAFLDQETSVDEGFPTELYKFVRGSDVTAFTSNDQEIVFGGDTFVPTLIKRTQPAQTAERLAANIKVTVARDNPVVSDYRIVVPSNSLFLTVFRYHRSIATPLLPAPADVAVFWQGRIRAVKFTRSEAEMTCEPLSGFLKRDGLRMQYQSLCNHMLYGPDCTVDRTLFDVAFNADSVSLDGLTITSTGLTATPPPVGGIGEASFYAGGGFVQRGLIPEDRRLITDFNETGARDTITILNAFEGLNAGEALTAFAGCIRTRQSCNTKFDNIENFGGFPYIPGRNPFGAGGAR